MIRKIFTIAFIALAVSGSCQGGFQIDGKMSPVQTPAMVYLQYGKQIDSVETTDGLFRFHGNVAEPIQAFVSVRQNASLGRDRLFFWLENSKIDITASKLLADAQVSGSKTNDEAKDLDAVVSPNTNTIIRLMKEKDKQPTAERKAMINDSIALLVKNIKQIRTDYARTHTNTFMGMYVYYIHVLDSYVDPVFASSILDGFTPEMKASPTGIKALEKLETARRRQPGAAFTDFTQQNIDGMPFTLSSLWGKYVLVDFWASWCKPCRAENPNLVKAYTKLQGKNFEVVGVSLDQSKEAWELAVKKDHLPWLHVSDLQGWQNAVALQYGISSVPQNLLINPQGVIIAKNLRGEELTEKLKELIK